MKIIKERSRMTVLKEKLLMVGVGFALALVFYSGVGYWLSNHIITIQSPIIIESKKIIDPIPTHTLTPSPAPTESKKKPVNTKGSMLQLIPQVHAEEPMTIGPKEYIIDKIMAVFGEDGKTAVAVARCESGLRYNAVNHNTNGSTDYGIFQINSIHKAKYEGRNIFDVDTNIDVAYQIYKAQGFSPWVAWKSGCYKNFL